VYVDITQTIDKKVNSLKAHQSQYDKYTLNLEDLRWELIMPNVLKWCVLN